MTVVPLLFHSLDDHVLSTKWAGIASRSDEPLVQAMSMEDTNALLALCVWQLVCAWMDDTVANRTRLNAIQRVLNRVKEVVETSGERHINIMIIE